MYNGCELTLWLGCVLPFSLDQRLETASAGGFTGLTLSPSDLQSYEAEGLSRREVGQKFTDAGIRIAGFEPLAKWTPPQLHSDNTSGAEPASGIAEGKRRPVNSLRATCFETDLVLEMAADLGVGMVSALELLGNDLDLAETTKAFHELCERAAEHDIRVALEFVPFTGIPDLTMAWNIVRNAPLNGGLVVDAWHIFRGPDPSDQLELLRQIPGARIFALQLDDAPSTAMADLRTESREGRLLPGQGAQDLEALMSALRTIGAEPIVGPEVLSPDVWAMPIPELGRRLAETTRQVLGEI